MQINDPKELGKIIKAKRKEKNITQADLAASAKTGVRFIVDLEQGKETARIGKAMRVCRMLGLKIEIN